jgi:hypothetical protein
MDLDTAVLLLRIAVVLILYAFLLQVLLVIWRDFHQEADFGSTLGEGGVTTARLVLLDPAGTGLEAGTEFSLAASGTVGRRLPNTVVLPDASVSARHCRLAYRQGQWWVEDLQSANGTYVNGSRIEAPVPLQDGDEIDLAQVRLRMEIG